MDDDNESLLHDLRRASVPETKLANVNILDLPGHCARSDWRLQLLSNGHWKGTCIEASMICGENVGWMRVFGASRMSLVRHIRRFAESGGTKAVSSLSSATLPRHIRRLGEKGEGRDANETISSLALSGRIIKYSKQIWRQTAFNEPRAVTSTVCSAVVRKREVQAVNVSTVVYDHQVLSLHNPFVNASAMHNRPRNICTLAKL